MACLHLCEKNDTCLVVKIKTKKTKQKSVDSLDFFRFVFVLRETARVHSHDFSVKWWETTKRT